MTGLRSMEWMEAGSTKRVLIVEDNDDNRKILVYRLQRIGDLEIEEASNGLEALRTAERTPLDLVIMDVHMPVMDGLEAARRIRSLDGECGDVPIIALTAEPLDERRAEECSGVTDFIQKPIVDPAALRAKVAYWIQRRHGEQSFAPAATAAASAR
jgi:CheY-like chemotaxis protein